MTTPAERTRSVLGMGEVAEQLLPYLQRKADMVRVRETVCVVATSAAKREGE